MTYLIVFSLWSNSGLYKILSKKETVNTKLVYFLVEKALLAQITTTGVATTEKQNVLCLYIQLALHAKFMLSVKLEFKVRKNILAGLKYDFPHWLDGNKVSLSLGTRGLDTMKPPFLSKASVMGNCNLSQILAYGRSCSTLLMQIVGTTLS